MWYNCSMANQDLKKIKDIYWTLLENGKNEMVSAQAKLTAANKLLGVIKTLDPAFEEDKQTMSYIRTKTGDNTSRVQVALSRLGETSVEKLIAETGLTEVKIRTVLSKLVRVGKVNTRRDNTIRRSVYWI